MEFAPERIDWFDAIVEFKILLRVNLSASVTSLRLVFPGRRELAAANRLSAQK
jgi:hypothetical protein